MAPGSARSSPLCSRRPPESRFSSGSCPHRRLDGLAGCHFDPIGCLFSTWSIGGVLVAGPPGGSLRVSYTKNSPPARIDPVGRGSMRQARSPRMAGRGSPPGRSAARRRAAGGSSGRGRPAAPRGTCPRGAWAGLSGRSRPGEPVGRRDLLRAPTDDLRRQSVLPAVAQDQALGVGDLLAAPAQELPTVRRRSPRPSARRSAAPRRRPGSGRFGACPSGPSSEA